MKNSIKFLSLIVLSLFIFSCSSDADTDIDVKEPSDNFTVSSLESFDLVFEVSDSDGISKISVIIDDLDIIIEEDYDKKPMDIEYSSSITVPSDAAKGDYELHITVEDAIGNGVSKILDLTVE